MTLRVPGKRFGFPMTTLIGFWILLGPVGAVPPLWAQTSVSVPIPNFTGPVPVTDRSWPLMADDHLQHPVDLPAAGYVEEEFFVSGLANVYDWAEDGGVVIENRAAPYTTRILVRRPQDPARSSGRAYVELGNNARRYDWGFSWSLSYPHFIESGDTWVLVTYMSAGIDGLKQFNPERYAPLGFDNPDPQPCGRGGAVPAFENGLRWDMLSQLSALLRQPDGPAAGSNIVRVYAMSHGGELPTYVQTVHRISRLSGGGHVYDGFILHRNTRLTPLRECGAAPGPDDPIHVIRDAGVPVVRIVAETDVLRTRSMRREDSDAPGDPYRLYEVAGAPHADGAFYRHLPVLADQEAAGTAPFLSYWPFASQCTPEIPIQNLPLMGYVADAAIENLDRWVKDGTAPPRADRIVIVDDGSRLARDEFGNVRGGVRSPYVDVPRARYVTTTGGPGGCQNLGYSEPFGWSRLEEIYGDFDAYAGQVGASVEELVAGRWLTPEDGARIRAELTSPR